MAMPKPENPVPMMTARVRTGGWLARLGVDGSSRIGNAHNGSVFLFSGEFGASVTLAGANTQYPGYRI